MHLSRELAGVGIDGYDVNGPRNGSKESTMKMATIIPTLRTVLHQW